MPARALTLLAAFLLVGGCGGEPETASRPDARAAKTGGGDAEPAKLSDIREAEDEGGAHLVAPPPERKAPVFWGSPRGSTERQCVELPREGLRRSGEFATALLYLYDAGGQDGWGAKMPWSPLHLREEYFANEGEVRGVTVRTASFERPSEIKTQKFVATSGFGELGEAYPSYVRLPGEGPWRMVATSGPDWGCFDLEPAET